MIAKNLASGELIEVVEADKYVKRVFRLAEWMYEDYAGHVCAFTFADKGVEERLDKGQAWKIDGKTYFPRWTNKHDELVRFYNEELKKFKQMSLFDYGVK